MCVVILEMPMLSSHLEEMEVFVSQQALAKGATIWKIAIQVVE